MKRTKNNRFNVEWTFAKTLWKHLKNDLPRPETPKYTVWEVDEATGKEVIVKQVPITVMRVVYNGKEYS